MEEIRTGTFVVPGTFLATVEEFMCGEGTYKEGGKIYSSRAGIVLVDVKGKKISVVSKSGPPQLKRGDVVVGVVEEMKKQAAGITVYFLAGSEKSLPYPTSGILRISNVRRGFVPQLERELKEGDLVKARVLDVKNGTILLTTDGPELGVVLAYCSRCRGILERVKNRLYCRWCGNTETRKVASEYGGEYGTGGPQEGGKGAPA
jgi:exosome complex component CSL4